MLHEKRGYFFFLDAILGLFVLVIGVLLITSSYVNIPKPTQVGLLADDLLGYLSTKKIKDLNNPYAGIGGELWDQDIIIDADNSLLQQIGEFYATNELVIADKFIENVSKGVVPLQFNYEVWLDNKVLYPRLQSAAHNASKTNTQIMLTSKTITFGLINKSTSDIWGPYKAEVYVWEK